MTRLLLVLAGGGCGSVLRHLVALWLPAGTGGPLPLATLAVNVAGGFLIGVLATLADERGVLSADLRALLVTGVLGGFTTFSAFSLETVRLWDEGRPGWAVTYVAASVLLCVLAAAGGVALCRLAVR